MNDKDADRQISQMVAFIQQEAKEKAEEIEVKTESEFNAKKLTKIEQARQETIAEYAKKRKEFGSERRIARSRLVTGKRFETMQARDELLDRLREDVRERLGDVAKHAEYPALLRALMVEGFATVLEDRVQVVCRAEDEKIVRAELPAAVAEYKRILKEENGQEPDFSAEVGATHLPPAGKKGSQANSCAGGVTITARAGKVVCRNTLDSRFTLAYQQLLPQTRQLLFGARATAKKE